MLARLAGSTRITELDLVAVYHQILIHKDSWPLIAFTDLALKRRYQWTRMFFGDVEKASHLQREVEKTIKVDGGKPFFIRQYPVSEKVRELVGKRVGEWVKNGWVEETKAGNPYNTPLCAQPKVSSGEVIFDDIRLCMDARELNKRNSGHDEYMIPKF